MRLIVTGIDDRGKSTVVRDEVARGGRAFAHLWPSDPGASAAQLEPEAGGVSWRIFDLPPDAVVAQYLAAQGGEDDGFHTTDTTDFVLILDGEVTLELDHASVELRGGDCVVQQGTRHAWRNRTDTPVRMAVVMLSNRRG